MTIFFPAPADRGSAATAAAVGACVGLAIGAAYVAGALARSAMEDAQGRLVAGAAPASALRVSAPSLRMSGASTALSRPPLLNVDLRGSEAPARDLECLSQAVYYEARGEEERGRKAVAQVVINRTRQPRYPKSVCGVVFQHAQSGCAFSFACDGQTRHALEPQAWRDARRIAQAALAGAAALPELRLATDFRGGGGEAPAGLARVAQIGGHVFYRWTGIKSPPVLGARTHGATAPAETTPLAAQAELVKADVSLKPEAASTTPAA